MLEESFRQWQWSILPDKLPLGASSLCKILALEKKIISVRKNV